MKFFTTLFSGPDGLAGKKSNRKDAFLLTAVCLACLVYMIVFTRGTYLYGSETDWDCQHSVLPEYFRNLFYSTGDLFPSFAPNIGAGENIFCLSYYGLLSPIVLFSYLLPFVDMTYYLMGAAIVSFYLTVIFFYLWIRKRFDRRISLYLTIFLAFCGPLLFHSHRHIMFVIYLPFLIAALHFVDVWFETGRKAGLVILIFLIITSSYLYSVVSLLGITLYGIYRFLERRQEQKDKPVIADFFRTGLPFLLLLLIAVLMAGALLIPTAVAIPECRESTNQSITLTNLLPKFEPYYLTFGCYSMGLTSFFIFAIIQQIVRGKGKDRFIAIFFALAVTNPALIYLMNAFMYLDGKALIPLLPLGLLICGRTLSDLFEGRLHLLPELPIFVALSVWRVIYPLTKDWRGFYLPDFLMVTVVLLLFYFLRKAKYKNLLAIPLPAVLIIACFGYGSVDRLTTVSDYRVENSGDLYDLVEMAVERSDGVDRTAISISSTLTAGNLPGNTESDIMNKVYHMSQYGDTVYSSLHRMEYFTFLFDEMCIDDAERENASVSRPINLYFNLYIGNRYWISYKDSPVPIGYEEIARKGDYILYETDDSLPVGYATTDLMSVEQFETLSFPETMEALLRYTLVEDAPYVEDFQSDFEKISCDDLFTDFDQMTLTDDGFLYQSGGTTTYSYTLPEECEGMLVVLRFSINNWIRGYTTADRSVWVNGVRNVITQANWKYFNHNSSFEYVLTPEEGNTLNFTFGAGTYRISDPELWIVDPATLEGLSDSLDPFEIDRERTKGDDIYGSITVTQDGYFNLSFLYGRGYTVTVDGQEITPEKVDTCFIGFPISAGEHEIHIHYTSPGLTAGKIVSLVGFAGLGGVIVSDVRLSRKKKRIK
ncbi:MAG: YfhO family protein [Eubacteriales bacterium]